MREKHRAKNATKRLAFTQDKILDWGTQIERREPREMTKRVRLESQSIPSFLFPALYPIVRAMLMFY